MNCLLKSLSSLFFFTFFPEETSRRVINVWSMKLYFDIPMQPGQAESRSLGNIKKVEVAHDQTYIHLYKDALNEVLWSYFFLVLNLKWELAGLRARLFVCP